MPAHHELPLFDVTKTVPTRCDVCGALREPGEDKAGDCQVDRERATEGYTRARPASCLNTWDPTQDRIPY
jgi:hypothetical protein